MTPLDDQERTEICNLLAGAIARHSRASDHLLAVWKSALYKMQGTDKAVFVRTAASAAKSIGGE